MKFLIFVLGIVAVFWLEVVQLASFHPSQSVMTFVPHSGTQPHEILPEVPQVSVTTIASTSSSGQDNTSDKTNLSSTKKIYTSAQFNASTQPPVLVNNQNNPSTPSAGATTQSTPSTPTSQPTTDDDSINTNSDPDSMDTTTPGDGQNSATNSPNANPNGGNSGGPNTGNETKPPNQATTPTGYGAASPNQSVDIELNLFLYSMFIVYVSFIKLVYHNIAMIKSHISEPGVLMFSGIVWELIARQVTSNNEATPKFNSRIFFYLFLPSTVLESASLLSNKWLFINLLPILIHSIIGTLLYASALGFTIYALSRENFFSGNTSAGTGRLLSSATLTSNENPSYYLTISSPSQHQSMVDLMNDHLNKSDHVTLSSMYQFDGDSVIPRRFTSLNSLRVSTSFDLVNNLTLADCLMFGTVLSSIDSNVMLGVFSLLQVNEKLYYLVLGEGLMNNAVVLVLFNLLLEFFNTTRLTIVKIYIAIIQFFITLIGSIFIGFILACIALISVRITKRFQVSSALTIYQNQYQAMVETLLVLKLAYLSYTLANMAGTSSIVSLATYGILYDQYIKHNMNLRSQLTFRQVILATKTMGHSLVYPLLGMLLVEVTDTSQFLQTWLQIEADSDDSQSQKKQQPQQTQSQLSQMGQFVSFNEYVPLVPDSEPSPVSMPATRQPGYMIPPEILSEGKFTKLTSQVSLNWNFKFLSIVILIVVVYRFVVVILLSFACNIFCSRQLRIKFKEQLVVASGALKGPLVFALIHKLIEHEEYRDRTRNSHLFIYTVLVLTLLSTLLKGSCVKPIVARMNLTLCCVNPNHMTNDSKIVFDEINYKMIEYTTQGLNSIVGHRKSPYDKFVEFNETHIKPWLSRSGSDTNWLSVFYDNLILDETLNANSFYRSFENPSMQFYWHLESRKQKRASEIQQSIAELALIGVEGASNPQTLHQMQRQQHQQEHPMKRFLKQRSTDAQSIGQSDHQAPYLIQRQLPMGPSIASSSMVTSDPRQAATKSQHYRARRRIAPQSDVDNVNGALKEFVMLDLKLDRAAERRGHRTATGREIPRRRRRNAPYQKLNYDNSDDYDMDAASSLARGAAGVSRARNTKYHKTDGSLPVRQRKQAREQAIQTRVARRPKSDTSSQSHCLRGSARV